MADQTVRIDNMPDSGSAEAVAPSLWRALRDHKTSTDEQLKFFTRCITAVRTTDSSYYNLFNP